MTENETVTVEAILDEQGNGLFPSDTAITNHNGIPLTDYLNDFEKGIETTMKKPKGFNQIKNIIECPAGTDPHDLEYTGYYACDSWKEGTLPVLTVNSILHLEQTLTNSKRLVIFYPSSENEYEDICSDGTWSGWKEPRKEEHTSITFMNGWTGNGHEPILTKIGNIIWFNAVLRNGTNTVGTAMCTIPAGYRPYYTVNASAITSLGNGLVSIANNGIMTLAVIVPDKKNVQISAMWRIK